MLVVPTDSAVYLLEKLRPILNAGLCRLQLYQNDFTPGPGTVFGDFMPCDFPGYPGMTSLNFGQPAFDTGNNSAEIDADPVSFTCEGGAVPQQVFGYYVFFALGPVLLWAERLQNRATMTASGDFLAFTPSFNAQSII